jgi:hypothetical protein
VNKASRLLQRQREVERRFVEEELRVGREHTGWSPALLMFHLAQWRERLTVGLTDFRAGREYAPPPANIDEFNDSELPKGAGAKLEEQARRADTLMAEMIELSEAIGDRPFKWNITSTSAEAILRNSYLHPRVHLTAYYRENGEGERTRDMLEQTVADLRAESGPPIVLGAALVNLAAIRAASRRDEALSLLGEGLSMRPDLKAAVAREEDFAPLQGDPRFQELISS